MPVYCFRRNWIFPEYSLALTDLKKHLVDGASLSDLCDQNSIHPAMFYRWRKAFFEKGHLVVFQNSATKSSAAEKQIVRLEQKLTKKNEVLSELMEEHVALEKVLGKSECHMGIA